MFRPFSALAAAAVVAFAPTTSLALGGPPDASAELRASLQDLLRDYVSAVSREMSASTGARSPGGPGPWADPQACARPRFQLAQATGRYMADHVRRPRRGGNALGLELGLSTRFVDNQFRNAWRQLPPPGQAQFLQRGERLNARPGDWNEALRQRAEWAVALEQVAGATRAQADGSIDFQLNFSAAVWTALDCEYRADTRRFLDLYEKAAGGQGRDSGAERAYAWLRGAGSSLSQPTME